MEASLDFFIDFGERLIETEDLDPVYVAIHKADIPRDQLARLLLSYWSFYHLGSSAYMSEREGKDFWRVMRTAAENVEASPLGGRWPRAAERRHFRGAKCVAAVDWLSQNDPESYVANLTHRRMALEIMDTVRAWPQFGPWIAFKAADMIERCCGARIEFDPNLGLMYKEPRAALDLLDAAEPERPWRLMLNHFSTFLAPPAYDRPCGPAEVETVLCKGKSALSGHYPEGKDTAEVAHGLEGWGDTAEKMRKIFQ